MNEEKSSQKEEKQSDSPNKVNENASSGALYGQGFIGAIIYFISTAGSFWMGVLGILKAMVWPAFLVYHALIALGV